MYQLVPFKRCLHSPCKKPLTPSCTVQMSDTNDTPMPIPLLAAALRADMQTLTLAYGNHLQPVMEKVVSVHTHTHTQLQVYINDEPILWWLVWWMHLRLVSKKYILKVPPHSHLYRRSTQQRGASVWLGMFRPACLFPWQQQCPR